MDISQIKDTAGNQYLIKDAQCRSDLSLLSSRYLGLATTVLDQGFRIDDIEVVVPSGTSTSNKLVNNNTLTSGLATKQDLLTAGANITITNGVISANVPGISIEVVSVLPATGETDKIYLVPKTTAQTSNVYDEYIYVNNNFELIGDTEIDLTNYYTKAETAAAINAGDSAVMTEVNRVENLVNINTANISHNTQDIATINSSLTSLQTAVGNNTTDIGTLTTTVNNVTNTVYDLSHDVQDNTLDIALNSSAITGLQTDVATLTTNKQNKLTVGDGIKITNANVISSLNPSYSYVAATGEKTVAPQGTIVEVNNPAFAYEYIIYGHINNGSIPSSVGMTLTLESYGAATNSISFGPINYISGTPPSSTDFVIKITTGFNPGIALAFVEVHGIGGMKLYTMPTNMQYEGHLQRITLTNTSTYTPTFNVALYRRYWL